MEEVKSAFLFQGIGGCTYKDKKDLFSTRQLEEIESCAKEIKEVLGLDLWAYWQDDTSNEQMELLEWLLVFLCDCILYKEYEKLKRVPDKMVGYSMGLITAMVCVGAITLLDGARLLVCIYDYPVQARRTKEAMGAMIGLEKAKVEELIEDLDLDDCVEIASENNETCIIIGGIQNAVLTVLEVAPEYGSVKEKVLQSRYAFHTSFGKKGIACFEKLVDELVVHRPNKIIYSLFSLENLIDEEALKRELVLNMFSQMRLKEAILKLGQEGYHEFYQVSLSHDLIRTCKVIDLKNIFKNNLDIR